MKYDMIILIADAFVVLAILVLSIMITAVMPDLEYPSVNDGVFPIHCPNYRNYSKVTFYRPVVPDPPTPAPPGVEVDGASSSSSSNESSSNVTAVSRFNYTLLQPETGLIKSVDPATWLWVQTGIVYSILIGLGSGTGSAFSAPRRFMEVIMVVLGVLALLIYLFRLCWVIIGTYLYSNLCKGEVSPQFANNLFMATIALGWIEILAVICTIVVPYLVEKSNQVASSAPRDEIAEMIVASSDEQPLHEAARNGDLDKVKTLVEVQHLDIHAKDNYGDTALHFAARNGHLPVVEYLLEHGADIHAKTHTKGRTALHEAAQHANLPEVKDQCLSVVEYLLAHGADGHDKDNIGDTPFQVLERMKK